MKKRMFLPILTFLTASAVAFTNVAHGLEPGEMQDRDARIRFQLRQGAFRLHGGVYNQSQTTPPGTPSPLKGLRPSQIREQLQKWGVSYLFQLDQTDLKKPQGQPFYSVEDFMGNAEAESRGGTKFQAQPCGENRAGGSALAARFKRSSPQEASGGYLLVNEFDPGTTNLSAYEGFSVGSWIQLNDGEGKAPFPILTKSPLNQLNSQGKNEWSFWVTGNVVYLNIQRHGHTQNLNYILPWWGDRFGSCYERGIYRDCWHYVAISFDPAVNKISVLFLRKFANKMSEAAAESFYTYETSAKANALAIESSVQTPLRIGGSNAASMDGILKGVFFARSPLSPVELRAMADLTEPKRDALFCKP